MIFSKEQQSKIKKLHNSMKDAVSYGTTFLEIDSIDEISLSSIIKTIKDTTNRFSDILLEVTRGKVEKTDSKGGSAFIKFVIQVSDRRGTRQDWGDITVGVRYSSKKFAEMMNTYLNGNKFVVAKFAQDISKKLKQYEGKTIYKNKTIPDSKVKDAQIELDFYSEEETLAGAKKDAMHFAKQNGCKLIKFKDLGNTYSAVFEGTEKNLKKLLNDGGYDEEDYEDFKIKDSKVKDASPDVDHIADYLWTWGSDSAGGWNADTIIEDYITPETLTEENLKKGEKAAEKELDKVYSQLQTIVNKKLKEGYERQKKSITQRVNWFRKHEKYQG